MASVRVTWVEVGVPEPSAVSTPVEVTCGVGAVVAAGLTATIPSGVTIDATVGAATASGVAANVASTVDITAAVGAATASGVAANVASTVDITAAVGAATASGVAANVASTVDITATAGAALAGGVASTVSSPIEIQASVGQATASGVQATVASPQVARPSSVISAGAWTPSGAGTLAQMLDETVRDDGDYISTTSPSTCEIALSAVTDPASSAGHVLRYAIEGTGGSLTVRLMCGAVEIASWVESSPPGTFTTVERTLSGAQADAITNYADLRVTHEAA